MLGLSSRRAGWLSLAALLACEPADASEPDAPAPAPAAQAEGDEASPPAAGDPTAHAAAAPGAAADDEEPAEADGLLHLRPPPMRPPEQPGQYLAVPPTPRDRTAYAFQFDAPVFRLPNAARRISGLVRRNTRLAVDRWVPGDGCSKSWYALLGGGYVCTSDGFSVSSDPAPLSDPLQVEPPTVEQALPYRYAKVKTPAPLFWRLPTAGELASSAAAPVREHAQGAHFVAMDQTHQVGETTFHRTVRGFFVREDDLEPKPLPTMHGEKLSRRDELPLAFVHVEEAVLVDPASGASRGTAERFARFAVDRVQERDGQTWVVARDGFAVARDQVRVLVARDRPEEVAADDQWIDVDLSQQTLVAYQGDTPVLATLVSSGKEGFEPPLGVFRVHKKYTTVTMSGPDPDAGTYAVEQVPWTMYYWGSFALHGAYWHDEFGKVRSHGCTNIPPVDARFLFYWSEPALPDGWHAEVGLKGPWVRFSRGEAATDGA